jgi:hypothetical protein
MEKEAAALVLQEIKMFEDAFDRLTELTFSLEQDEAKRIRSAIATAMSTLYLEVKAPLLAQFPDLSDDATI